MKPHQLTIACLTLCLLTFCAAGQVAAQNNRTYVSVSGSDTNGCTSTEPCRQINRALSLTNAHGEVIVLSSGPYKPFTVTTSALIAAAPGVYAGITLTEPGTRAVTVAAGTNDSVTIKGLTFTGVSNSKVGSGVDFQSGVELHIEGCTFNNLLYGVNEKEHAAGTGTSRLSINNSIFDVVSTGVHVYDTNGGSTRLQIDHSRFEGCWSGIYGVGSVSITARETIVTGGSYGFYITGTAARLSIEDCTVTHHGGIGIETYSGGVIRLSRTTVTENNRGVYNFEGTILSRGDNTIEGNITDLTGTLGRFWSR